MAVAHHIQRLQQKPEHVRRRIAVGTSVGVTGVAALVWAIALISSGALQFGSGSQTLAQGAPGSEGQGDTIDTAIPQAATGISSLVGAASAAFSGKKVDPTLNIVDTPAPQTTHTQPAPDPATATIIPF